MDEGRVGRLANAAVLEAERRREPVEEPLPGAGYLAHVLPAAACAASCSRAALTVDDDKVGTVFPQ
jgi:hypothetical protein